MFRMSTNGKNFKKVIDKMVTAMPKVTYLSALKSIKLEVCGNQATAYATDGDRYIKLNIGCAWEVQDGKILLNEDNLKAISRMEKDIDMSERENVLTVKSGKKTINMPLDDVESFPELPKLENFQCVGTVIENDFLDAIVKLYPFIGDNNICNCYSINWETNRIFAMDSHRAAWKNLKSEKSGDKKDYRINGSSMKIFKKILDKKSEKPLSMYDGEKYILMENSDFQYIQRKPNASSINYERIIEDVSQYSFKVASDNLQEVVEYNAGLDKSGKNPMIFRVLENSLYTYFHTTKYETMDEIKITDSNFYQKFLIGFNPAYLNDILNICDGDIEIKMSDPKGISWIMADSYGFVILPINVKEMEKIALRMEDMLKGGIV